MFCVGQYIVYGNSGICRVEAVGTPGFMKNSPKEYYTLRPFYTTNNTRIYVPVNTGVYMRSAITSDEALQYLDYLKNMEVKVFRAPKQNLLAEHYRELIAQQDISGYLRLFKEVCYKEKLAKNSGKKLGQVDLHFYKLAERILSEEFSIVLQETPDCSKKRLYDAAASVRCPDSVKSEN